MDENGHSQTTIPDRDSNPGPLASQRDVLTTRPQGRARKLIVYGTSLLPAQLRHLIAATVSIAYILKQHKQHVSNKRHVSETLHKTMHYVLTNIIIALRRQGSLIRIPACAWMFVNVH